MQSFLYDLFHKSDEFGFFHSPQLEAILPLITIIFLRTNSSGNGDLRPTMSKQFIAEFSLNEGGDFGSFDAFSEKFENVVEPRSVVGQIRFRFT